MVTLIKQKENIQSHKRNWIGHLTARSSLSQLIATCNVATLMMMRIIKMMMMMTMMTIMMMMVVMMMGGDADDDAYDG